MDYTLKDQEMVKLSILGINYIVKADGRISNGQSTANLEDIFASLPKNNTSPNVDYTKISTDKFIHDRVSRTYLSNNNVFNLKDFIDLNEKTLLETNQEKDIFNDMIVLTLNKEFHAMSEIPIGRGIGSYSFLYCIANIYSFTGEMPVNISSVRSENSSFDITEVSQDLLKFYDLSEDDINKRYYKHYKKS